MFPFPDWQTTVTMEEVRKNFNPRIELGWNETKIDTALLLKIQDEDDKYKLYIWNRPNVRLEVADIVRLPYTKLEF